MKLNHDKQARKMVNVLLAKNGKTAREISEKMGYSEKSEVTKALNGNISIKRLTAIVQAINENYRIRVDFISPTHYQIITVVKNSPQIVHSYFVDETVHP